MWCVVCGCGVVRVAACGGSFGCVGLIDEICVIKSGIKSRS